MPFTKRNQNCTRHRVGLLVDNTSDASKHSANAMLDALSDAFQARLINWPFASHSQNIPPALSDVDIVIVARPFSNKGAIVSALQVLNGLQIPCLRVSLKGYDQFYDQVAVGEAIGKDGISVAHGFCINFGDSLEESVEQQPPSAASGQPLLIVRFWGSTRNLGLLPVRIHRDDDRDWKMYMSSPSYLNLQRSDALLPLILRIGESVYGRLDLDGLIGMILRTVDGDLVLEQIDLHPYPTAAIVDGAKQSMRAPTFDALMFDLISERIKYAAR